MTSIYCGTTSNYSQIALSCHKEDYDRLLSEVDDKAKTLLEEKGPPYTVGFLHHLSSRHLHQQAKQEAQCVLNKILYWDTPKVRNLDNQELVHVIAHLLDIQLGRQTMPPKDVKTLCDITALAIVNSLYTSLPLEKMNIIVKLALEKLYLFDTVTTYQDPFQYLKKRELEWLASTILPLLKQIQKDYTYKVLHTLRLVHNQEIQERLPSEIIQKIALSINNIR